MKRSVVAVLFSLFAVSTGLGFGWLYLRSRGARQAVAPAIEHPFLRDSLELIAWRGSSTLGPENTWPSLDLAANLDPDIILWVDVQPSSDGTLVLLAERELERTTNGTGLVGFTPAAQLAELDASAKFKPTAQFPSGPTAVPRLDATLQRYPKHRFVLNFADYRNGVETLVLATLRASKAFDRVLIHSPAEYLLNEVRKEEGRWLFGSSPVRLTQLHILNSLGLAQLGSISGDIVIDLGSRLAPAICTSSLVSEVHRRHLRYFAGPAANGSDWQRLIHAEVDGIITATPEKVLTEWRAARKPLRIKPTEPNL